MYEAFVLLLAVLPNCIMTLKGSQRFHLIQNKNEEAVCDTSMQSTWESLHSNSTKIQVFCLVIGAIMSNILKGWSAFIFRVK